jgi:hypothetical protein
MSKPTDFPDVPADHRGDVAERACILICDGVEEGKAREMALAEYWERHRSEQAKR